MVDSTKSDSKNNSQLKPYYVYVLMDTSNNEVFYVGKGQGVRVLDHRKDSLKAESNSAKFERIRAIQESGKSKVKEMVVGRFATDQEAFAVEATLIHWMYGHKNLTNIVCGHHADTIREKGDHGELKGVDVPANWNYSEGFAQARDRFGVIENIEEIKKFLEKNSDLRFGAVDSTHARWTTISLEIKGLRLVVGKYNSSGGGFWIEIQPVSNKKADKDQLVELCAKSKFEAKNNGGYAKLPGYGNKLTDPNAVLVETLKYYDELSGNRT